jgi:hypothetical protein
VEFTTHLPRYQAVSRIAVVFGLSLLAVVGFAKPTNTHGYSTGHFALEMDGIIVGWVNGVEGGSLTSDVVTTKLSQDHLLPKSIAGFKYTDISLRFGTGMGRQVFDWIKAEMAGDYTKHYGAIITTDFSYKVVQRLEFQNSLLSEVTFPTLDGGSKDAGFIKIKISPQSTKFLDVTNGSTVPAPSLRERSISPSNFRLTLTGLDCTRVNHIDALAVQEKFVDVSGAVHNTVDGSSGLMPYPNLVILTAESAATTFYNMVHANATAANRSVFQTTSGRLDYLDPSNTVPYFTLVFGKLTPFAFTPITVKGESIKRDRVDMSNAKIGFEYSNAALG